jgi:hypothetical protein
VFHGWHVDEETPGERNVRSNARALFGNWLLCDLDQNLLPFAQQVSNGRLVSLAPRLTAMWALIPLATRVSRAWRRLGNRRDNDLFRDFRSVRLVNFLVLTVTGFHVCSGSCLLVLARAASSSPAAPGSKLAA